MSANGQACRELDIFMPGCGLHRTLPAQQYRRLAGSSLTADAFAQVREYLEKSYEETEGSGTVKLAIKALMEVVEAGSKNLEIAVMEKGTGAGRLLASLKILASLRADCIFELISTHPLTTWAIPDSQDSCASCNRHLQSDLESPL